MDAPLSLRVGALPDFLQLEIYSYTILPTLDSIRHQCKSFLRTLTPSQRIRLRDLQGKTSVSLVEYLQSDAVLHQIYLMMKYVVLVFVSPTRQPDKRNKEMRTRGEVKHKMEDYLNFMNQHCYYVDRREATFAYGIAGYAVEGPDLAITYYYDDQVYSAVLTKDTYYFPKRFTETSTLPIADAVLDEVASTLPTTNDVLDEDTISCCLSTGTFPCYRNYSKAAKKALPCYQAKWRTKKTAFPCYRAMCSRKTQVVHMRTTFAAIAEKVVL